MFPKILQSVGFATPFKISGHLQALFSFTSCVGNISL